MKTSLTHNRGTGQREWTALFFFGGIVVFLVGFTAFLIFLGTITGLLAG